jgi:alpha-ketoglutarate-dependent taurine dioxygenase
VLHQSKLFNDCNGPQILQPDAGCPCLVDAIGDKVPEIRQRLSDHGALLFRGFAIKSAADFDSLVQHFSQKHLKYIYRSTPRNGLTEKVYTATNYPAQLEIPLHNENAYQKTWPLTVAFCCVVPPGKGGETPIAHMNTVGKYIDEELLQKFEQLGVEYIRHYHDGVDLSWQVVFQTDDRKEMQKYCTENAINWEWREGELLRTSHVAQGVAYHPTLETRVFFNQAHLFHVSSLGAARANAVKTLFGTDKLPRHARFGDGSEISAAELDQVRQAFKRAMTMFPWQSGDVLILDNMQYAHGRQPFEGQRSILASLMDPYTAPSK